MQSQSLKLEFCSFKSPRCLCLRAQMCRNRSDFRAVVRIRDHKICAISAHSACNPILACMHAFLVPSCPLQKLVRDLLLFFFSAGQSHGKVNLAATAGLFLRGFFRIHGKGLKHFRRISEYSLQEIGRPKKHICDNFALQMLPPFSRSRVPNTTSWLEV